jgi:uncharacterized Zn-finger protein
MSAEESGSEEEKDEAPFDFALLGIVEKPCKEDIKKISSPQEDPQSAAEGLSSEEESSSEEEERPVSSKKRIRRTVKPKAKGRKKPVAAAASSNHDTCPHCQKKFTKTSSLVIHVRSHTGEKAFVCDDCEKGFARKWNLYVEPFDFD